jgi:hypothetical protein
MHVVIQLRIDDPERVFAEDHLVDERVRYAEIDGACGAKRR